jgi:hypothetical protein
MSTFRRILSTALFAIGVLWQLFIVLGVSFSEKKLEDFAFAVLFSFATVGILYVSLKIRATHPRKRDPEA